jgi:hypothetical protein
MKYESIVENFMLVEEDRFLSGSKVDELDNA